MKKWSALFLAACMLSSSSCRSVTSASPEGSPVVVAPDVTNLTEMSVTRVGYSPAYEGWVIEVQAAGVRDAGTFVHLVVGEQEATVLNMKLARQSSVRPMTHDLTLAMVKELGGAVKLVVVEDLREGIFLARVYFADRHGRMRAVDSRASDAIILAVATGTKIHFTKQVIRAAGIKTKPPPSAGEAI